MADVDVPSPAAVQDDVGDDTGLEEAVHVPVVGRGPRGLSAVSLVMPEGHTIHRLARDHTRLLGGQALHVTSPQGRASAAAQAVDGRVLDAVDAHGKHLLYRFAGVEGAVHVHLGLFGRFVTRRKAPIPQPRATTRLRLVPAEDPDALAVDLSGATASELLDPAQEDALLARLGPDPLRRDGDPDAFAANLARRRIPIGAALLDQAVVAGIGNVYRAEVLHACRVDPYTPAREVPADTVRALWDTTVAMLREGVRLNRIVTTPPELAPAGKPRSRLRRDERVVVYRRSACLACGGPVTREELAMRTLFWCPACQRG